MRIIGGHDYYDSAIAYGRDPTVIFLRTGDRRLSGNEVRRLLKLPMTVCSGSLGIAGHDPQAWSRPYRAKDEHAFRQVTNGRVVHDIDVAHVILCGVLHHGVHIRASEPFGIRRKVDERWIWSADSLRSYAAQHGLVVDEGKSGITQTRDFSGGKRTQVDVTVQTIEEWFAPVRLSGPARDALISQRITIASRNPTILRTQDADGEVRTWDIDQDTLGAMDFAKAIPPSEAFQEISMWNGGVLPKDGPSMVEITSDRIKIEKHGFHHPTSFRKAKAGS